ncbi:MAG: thiamine-phosphate kinase [Bacteroidota bacterium]|nr:thiamine-phosphate kinase [Bacteroidota bacterium]
MGEFRLIEKLTKDHLNKHKSTKTGIGDDSAILKDLKKNDRLISTDMLVEGVHFDPTYTPLKHLGYKSIVVNISDICAMNGAATHALVSLGIPNKYSVEHIEELYLGIKTACTNYNIDLIGGDTTSSGSGLIISITILGHTPEGEAAHRSGARANDVIFVSGDLGAAYLGLQVLEREKRIFRDNEKVQPELNEYSYVLERQLKPEARVDIVNELKKQEITPSSMIDLSDGLSSDLRHICKSSSVGVKIFEDKIPILKETREVANELGLNPVFCALHGGEDYELLFTAPPHLHERLREVESIEAIGHTTSEKDKIELITNSNQSIDLTSEGWDSFFRPKENI